MPKKTIGNLSGTINEGYSYGACQNMVLPKSIAHSEAVKSGLKYTLDTITDTSAVE